MPAHSPLPPLKLPNDPRPTFSMNPQAKFPSGMNCVSLRLYAELKLKISDGVGENVKLPRTPPVLAELVEITPSSELKLPERKYEVCCAPPRRESAYCCTAPVRSHEPFAGQVGSTHALPCASWSSGPLHLLT